MVLQFSFLIAAAVSMICINVTITSATFTTIGHNFFQRLRCRRSPKTSLNKRRNITSTLADKKKRTTTTMVVVNDRMRHCYWEPNEQTNERRSADKMLSNVISVNLLSSASDLWTLMLLSLSLLCSYSLAASDSSGFVVEIKIRLSKPLLHD